MARLSSSEKLLLEEVAQAARKGKEIARGLDIGSLIKMIRMQIGMTQKILSKRAGVPQSTVSRLEKNVSRVTFSTLNKILQALSCELVVLPMLLESIDIIRRKQAKKVAEGHMRYLSGTMNLEAQEPDSKLLDTLCKEEEERLLHGPNSKLWEP